MIDDSRIDNSQPSHIYGTSLALLTDFYQLTMACGYWKAGLDKKQAVFHHFFRRSPFQGGFTIAAGLASLVDFLEHFRFQKADLDYLATLRDAVGNAHFDDSFLNYLEEFRFSCDVDAVPEGTVVFPYEPLIRVQGPLLQCQLLESPLLNLINFPTLIATKAARIQQAAQGDSVLEFGMRRAQGIDGALTASRSAYIGGCNATSNVLAGKLFGIPVSGTHSHSWIMVFDDELAAFETYAKYFPSNCVFLVDTYNTLEGVKKAIQVGKKLQAHGQEMLGIRLDSGDLAALSIQSRQLLDEAGLKKAKIVASNELDETLISELKRQGAQIAVWGVGTNLVTGKDQPALDGVYKLSAIRDHAHEPWQYKLKLSEQMLKVSNPGILQVKRFSNELENVTDVIYDINHPIGPDSWVVDPLDPTREKKLLSSLKSVDLLVPIFRTGKKVYSLPSLEAIRQRAQGELKLFPIGTKRFLNPHQYFVGMEKKLYQNKVDLIRSIRQKTP